MIACLRSLFSVLALLALAACASTPNQTEPPIRDELVNFIIQPGTAPEGNLAIDLGVYNGGDIVPANDDFNGVWRLARDGETRASGVVHQLQRLTSGETILMQWEGWVDPGSYELIWGAPGYGYTEANFEVLADESGGLRIGDMSIFETTADPPDDLVPLIEEDESGQ